MQSKKVPGWGKTIGILMIIMSSLGVFYQMYRLIIPRLLNFQSNMMNTFMDTSRQVKSNIEFNDSTMREVEFDEMIAPVSHGFEELNDTIFHVSETSTNYMYWFSLLMLVVCVFYIIAGTKLMKPALKNYQFAITILIISIAVNILSYILIFSNANSLILYGVMFYSFIGTVADIVFLIIIKTSDRSAYGIGSPVEVTEF